MSDDPRDGLPLKEADGLITDTDMWVLMFSTLVADIVVLIAGYPLMSLVGCVITWGLLAVLWFKPEGVK